MSFLLFLGLIITAWLGYNILRIQKLIQVSSGIQTVSPYTQTPQESTQSILIAGDSTALGTGSLKPSLTVAGRIGSVHPEATITNLSKNGRKTGELVETLKSVEGQHYDVVLLQIGGNDIIRFVSLAQVTSDIEKLLVEAKKLSPHVILTTSGDVGQAPFFPRPLNTLWSKRTREVRSIFQNACDREGVIYVDLLALGVDDVFHTDITKYYSPDMLHPSSDGYGVWYQHIGPVVESSLAK